jgi:hypothetical protein
MRKVEPMFSTEFYRTISDERERQVREHVRVRNLIRPHRPGTTPVVGPLANVRARARR